MAYNWQTLKQECLKCTKCGLCATRTNVVFGVGNPSAEILFVGEGPGANEDAQGEPFVGRSGKLLDVYLDTVGLSRKKNIYIANIVKCRPPENRDPLPEERTACLPWLRAQFKLIKPKIIVCLGRIAAQQMIKPDFAITKEHGQWTEKSGVLFTATLHPAALLRNPTQKPLAFEDFAQIRNKINEICTHTYEES
ncbi:MAG: uracil-DNA glycosylase family protein [Oscillospiraceae bacterium]